MSNNLPFDIQVEILKRLPVKSLIQFRSVCKSWKSLIQSSDFIAHYRSQQQHLLVRYTYAVDSGWKYVLIADDDTFPHQKVSLSIPRSVKMPEHVRTVGSSQGLLFLYGDLQNGSVLEHVDTVSGSGTAVIWNPSIRKAVSVDVPNVTKGLYGTVVGFGVCNVTNDPKIVKINYINSWINVESVSCIPWQVEVYTLSKRVWRNPYTNLPRKSVVFDWMQVVVDGFLYWLAIDRIDKHGEFRYCNIIISFDMTSEEFREVNLPHTLASLDVNQLSMCKLRESLVVVEEVVGFCNLTFDVWMMENGVFTKLYTVNIPGIYGHFSRVFRKTSQPLFEIEVYMEGYKLYIYEPYSTRIGSLGINGKELSFVVHPYKETLLLLDYSNSLL